MRNKQETAKDGQAGLQSNFQNLNAKVNQNVDVRQVDRHTSIHRPELQSGETFSFLPSISPAVTSFTPFIRVYVALLFNYQCNPRTCQYTEH